MARQTLTLKALGLYTFPSELAVPDGAMSVADNIVIDRENVIEPRRGFDRLTYGFGTSTDRAHKLFFYKGKIFAHYATTKFGYYTGSAWTSNTSFSAPAANVKMRATEANQNLYITTSAGIYKLSDYTDTPTLAGAVKALGGTSADGSATSTFTSGDSRAYRVVWGYRDSNDNLILGAPSQRIVHTIAGASNKAIDLTIQIPEGVTTDWFYQLYASAFVSSGTPSDELGLVYEDNPTSGEITAKSLTISDITPDALRGADLYTNANQEGLAAANERPPIARNLTTYQGYTFYGNTTGKYRYTITLFAELAGSEWIEFGTAAEFAGSTQVRLTEGTDFNKTSLPTVAENIQGTAEALVEAINANSSLNIYAYYISGLDDLPGQILLEERSLGNDAFEIRVSDVTKWSPTFVDSSTNNTSSNDRRKNGLYWSKQSQPEAVPLANYLLVGSADKEIQRIIPLRDSMFILKEDGIFKLSGNSPSSFRVDLFDSTTVVLAPDTAVVLNNQIFVLTDQGVAAISDGGVAVLSRAIERDLLELLGVNADTLKNESFAVAYESERKYILFVPSSSGDTAPTQAYVYNLFTRTWTRWTIPALAGGVNPEDNKLYLANTADEYIKQEFKTYSYLDYADFGFSTTISAVSSTLITLSGSDNIAVGDILYQSSTKFASVTAVDSIAGTCTVAVDVSFSTGSATIYKAISTAAAWVPFTGGNPGALKQFSETSLFFKVDFTGTATVSFTTDESAYAENETISGNPIGSWGLFLWGEVPWGGENNRRPYRILIPRNKQRSSQITIQFAHATGYSGYQLNGISLVFKDLSSKVRRSV